MESERVDIMPKRTNKLESYFATRLKCPVDPKLQTCIDAWSVGEDLQPSAEFVAEFDEGCRSRSAEWRSKYARCDEFFREYSVLEGRFAILPCGPLRFFGPIEESRLFGPR